MVAYYKALEEHVAERRITVDCTAWHFPDDLLPEVLLEVLWSHLDTARQRAISEPQRLRIDQVRMELLCAELYLKGQSGPKQRIDITNDTYVLNPGAEATDPDKLALLEALSARLGIVNFASLDGRKLCLDHAKLQWRTEGESRFPIVRLTNGRIQAHIVPGLGGRILRLIGSDGHNYFFEPDDMENWQYEIGFGGYEEYAGRAFRSNGWSEPYSYTISDDRRSLVLNTMLALRGLRIERRVWLDGNAPRLHLDTTVTRTEDSHDGVDMIRAHPVIWLDLNQQAELLGMRNGKWEHIGRSGLVSETWLEAQHLPEGVWTIRDANGRGLINRFNVEEVDKCYVFWGNPIGTWKHMTFELFGKPRKLTQGQSVRLQHSYEIADLASPVGAR